MTSMICHTCGDKVEHWFRREHKVYCTRCFDAALKNPKGLSTQSTEEANLRKEMKELAEPEE